MAKGKNKKDTPDTPEKTNPEIEEKAQPKPTHLAYTGEQIVLIREKLGKLPYNDVNECIDAINKGVPVALK